MARLKATADRYNEELHMGEQLPLVARPHMSSSVSEQELLIHSQCDQVDVNISLYWHVY